MNNPAIQRRARGFARMDANKQREIASRGGRAAHAHGTAHKFSTEEARAAGRKGGEAISGNREHMARIGRLGGEARRARRAERNSDVPGNDTGNDNTSATSGREEPAGNQSSAADARFNDAQGKDSSRTDIERDVSQRDEAEPARKK